MGGERRLLGDPEMAVLMWMLLNMAPIGLLVLLFALGVVEPNR